MNTQHVTSADGTRIAYSVIGSGPAIVLVDGALCYRTMGPAESLAEALSGFAVHSYDRRGRGESEPGETPYHRDREIEDLAAVISAAGGHAHVFGSSSGGILAIQAAQRGVPINRLAVYEPPAIVDGYHQPADPQLPDRVRAMVDGGDRSGAVRAFMKQVGAPAPVVLVMRATPAWRRMTEVAHTLPYDLSLFVPQSQGVPWPSGHFAEVTIPTLVVVGGKSPQYMRTAQAVLAESLPDGHLEVLPGQTHMIKAAITAPVVSRFLAA